MTVLGILLALLVGQTAQEYQQRLRELEQKLQKTRQELKNLSRRERDTRRQLDLLNKEIGTLESILQVLERQEAAARRRLREVERRLNQGQQRLGEWYGLYKSLVARGAVQALVDTGPAYERATQENLLRYSAEVVDFYRGELRTLNTLKRRREQVVRELRELQAQYQERKRELERSKARRQRLLVSLRKKKAAKRREEQELLRTRQKLEEMLRQLAQRQQQRRRQQRLPTRRVRKGDLIWPARGRILARFGTEREPKYGTKTRNNGIDLLLAPGAEVRAAADGVVVFAGPFMAYGNTVILDHGGDMTVYAYLGTLRVRVNQQVRQGQVIGLMPREGSPILHFELRKGGRAVDPLKYLP